MSVSLSGTYDSNPSQGYGSPAEEGGADYFVSLGGTAGYRTTSSDWTFGANYGGSYNEYFTQAELGGYNQNAGLQAAYEGGPLSTSLSIGFGFGSGANRYYSSVVDQFSISYGLNARYRVSPKTSVTADVSSGFSTVSDGGFSDTGSLALGASALWRYSPLTEFGPGIRYTSVSGDSQQGRTSIGPTLTVNYKLSKKVSLNSQVGMDFAQYEDGQSADPSVSTSIALAYQASRLWGMNLSLNRNVQADPARAGEFYEATSLRVGYNRKVRRATLNLGMSYETTTSQAPEGNSTGPDRNFLSLDSSVGMPVFSNTCNTSVFIRYSDQSGGTSGESWDSMQMGFSISRSF